MMDLSNVSLLSLQTRFMKKDPTTKAMCAALDQQFRQLSDDIKRVLIYARVDQLDHDLLDELAWSMHVDAYDATASLTEKRRLIRSSIQIHKYKGTVYAIEQIVADVFGEQAEVLEWFDYEGQPYHFKVHVYCKDRGASYEDVNRATSLIMTAKNLRSILEGILIFLLSDAVTYIASVCVSGESVTVYPKEG